MKVKSLLFAALAASMSLAASAESYLNCNDKITAESTNYVFGGENNVTYQEVKLYLTRESDNEDFTNIQFGMIFPQGFHPYYDIVDGEKTFAGLESGDDVQGDVKSGPKTTHTVFVTFSDNFSVESFYPYHMTVGVNMTKTAITANPAHIATLYVMVDEDVAEGTYDFKFHTLKYTCYNDDSYTTLDARINGLVDNATADQIAQTICTFTMDTSSGVNDLNVATAKTYKTIENGQVLIVKDGVKYNTMGQIVK